MSGLNELGVGVTVPLMIVFAFILPALGLVIKKKAFFHVYASVVSLGVALVTTWNLITALGEGPQVYAFGGWPPPLGIVYEVDALSGFLGALTAWIMFGVVIYSTWYMKVGEGLPYYYTLLLGLETGLLGCYYTGDVFNFFVMLEVLSISAYALVGFYRNRPEAVEAAVKYGMIGAVATTVYFIALVFIYGAFGTLNIADLSLKSRAVVESPFSGGVYGAIPVSAAIALALSLWAFTYKSAVFPNHFWLPDAHPEAPTPVSATLSGLVINVGAYAVVRFLYTIFGRNSIIAVDTWVRDAFLLTLLVLGVTSGIVGALMMIVQEDVKRLLAYSTVSHVGLIFIGISIGFTSVPPSVVSTGLTGSLYHILNHSVGKALLFLSVGVLIVASGGKRRLDELAGLGRKYPIITGAAVIGFLQLMGLPPFGGFFSKFLLYEAFMAAGMPIIAALIVAISAVSVLGYSKVIYSIWFRNPKTGSVKKAPIPTGVVVALATACLLLGLLSPYLTQALTSIINGSVSSAGIHNYIVAFLNAAKSLGVRG